MISPLASVTLIVAAGCEGPDQPIVSVSPDHPTVLVSVGQSIFSVSADQPIVSVSADRVVAWQMPSRWCEQSR